MKKKTNSSVKGSKLEDFTVDFLQRLSDDFGFHIDKLRRQKSGTQYGKDVVWKFRVEVDGETKKYYWTVEDKNYDTKLSSQALGHKLFQIHNTSKSNPIDTWAVFSPKINVDNEFSEFLDSDVSLYPFAVIGWTPDEQIEKLVECYPDLYERLFGKKTKIADEEKKRRLKIWKEKILEDSAEGMSTRQSFRASTKQLEGDNTSYSFDKSEAKQLIKEAVEATLQAAQPRNVTKIAGKEIEDVAEKGLISIEIDDALKLLDNGQIQPALTSLFIILGKIEGKQGLQHELARTCNNIGVAYNRLGQNNDAIPYFKRALETEKGFVVPATNLASTFIVQAEFSKDPKLKAELLKKAESIIEPLMSAFQQGSEANVLHAQMRLLKVRDGASAVTSFIKDEANKKYSKVFQSSSSLMYFLGSLYMEVGDPDEAEVYAEKSVELNKDIETLVLRGRVRMVKALKNDAQYHNQSFEDIAPTFSNTEQIEKALQDFHDALTLAIELGDKQVVADIGQFEQIARLWMRTEEKPDNFEWPSENRYVSAVTAFRERKFEISYDLLKRSPEWGQLPPSEIWRLARVYLFNGAPEIAGELLGMVENVAEEEKNFQYWMDRSMVDVLLQNKNQAIYSATRAKELAQGEKQKRIALSHRGAVLLRFADEDGGDRILENSFEYEKEFPDSQILTRFDFEQDKEKILKMIQDRQKWVQGIQEKFKKEPIPSYYLEDVFHEPYIVVWRGRDPQLPISYTITSEEFSKELGENYEKGKSFVFDYISLLTLTKLNQLYTIEKYFPSAKISFSLFLKIQEELLRKEDPILRRLWDFLRRSTSINIVKDIPEIKLSNGKVGDIFGSWMEDTLKIAKEQNMVLVTDDFVVYRFSKSEGITPINTWYLLQTALANGDIDKQMYSKALGGLAECFYTFIGFDGEDLFQIIADDHFKLTARTYHLINQAFMPNANPQSFTQTFIPFMRRLWTAGVTSQDKVYWLSYITNISTDISTEVVRLQLGDDVFGQVATDSALIWNVAVTSGRIEDLELLKEELDTILKDQSLEMIKPTIVKKIDAEIAKFKPKEKKKK